MKTAAVINDLSGFGRCSLTAALPVLSVMGIQAVPLPTAVLSGQTGYPSYFYQDLTPQMEPIRREWEEMSAQFDGISTGFVSKPEQFHQINAFLDTFQREDTLVMVDPVMGDNGRAFGIFSPALLEGMRQLCQRGSILVPNLTECCLLTGTDYAGLLSLQGTESFLPHVTACGQALRRPGQTVIITGIQCPDGHGSPLIGNLALWDHGTFFHAQPYNGQSYSGTGDLFAAVVLGAVLRGASVEEAIRLADGFLAAAIADASQAQTDRNDGVPFERHLGRLLLREALNQSNYGV